MYICIAEVVVAEGGREEELDPISAHGCQAHSQYVGETMPITMRLTMRRSEQRACIRMIGKAEGSSRSGLAQGEYVGNRGLLLGTYLLQSAGISPCDAGAQKKPTKSLQLTVVLRQCNLFHVRHAITPNNERRLYYTKYL